MLFMVQDAFPCTTEKIGIWKGVFGLSSFHVCPMNRISETSQNRKKSNNSKREISPYLHTCEGCVLVGFYNHVVGFNISQSQKNILPPSLFQNLPKSVTIYLEESSSQCFLPSKCYTGILFFRSINNTEIFYFGCTCLKKTQQQKAVCEEAMQVVKSTEILAHQEKKLQD